GPRLDLGVQEGEPGCPVSTVIRIDHPVHDLHVLLRHRPRSIALCSGLAEEELPTGQNARAQLFRQPGGFEGLSRVGESPSAHDLALPQCVELGMALIHRQSAAGPAPFAHEEDYLVLAGRDDVLDLDCPVVPGICPAHYVIHDRFMATSDPPVGQIRSVPLDIRGETGQGGLDVRGLERIPHPAHDLDVLLRHRLLSIPFWPWRSRAGSRVIRVAVSRSPGATPPSGVVVSPWWGRRSCRIRLSGSPPSSHSPQRWCAAYDARARGERRCK